MARQDRRAARQRQQALEQAIEILKANPRFSAAQVQAHDRGEELVKHLSPEQSRFGTPERIGLALEILKIQAEAYLPLAEDMNSQEAFTVLLKEFGRKAFETFTGFPLEAVVSGRGDELQLIQQRVSHWVNEGYNRLIPSAPATIEQTAPDPSRYHAPETRESRLQSFLAEKNTTIAAVRRAADVHKTNMQQWRQGELSDISVMSERIEDVLSGKRPIG
jgi:hypothetical protein